MSIDPARHKRRYWGRNLRLTGVLLLAWFVFTFVTGYFARELATITFFGWPLSFYMGAQGSLIVYVAIVWFYARSMKRLDAEYDDRDGP